jgi:hypothetical protein
MDKHLCNKFPLEKGLYYTKAVKQRAGSSEQRKRMLVLAGGLACCSALSRLAMTAGMRRKPSLRALAKQSSGEVALPMSNEE